jgi:hypothetical protein
MRKMLLLAATWALALGGASAALAGGGCADAVADCGGAWGDGCGQRCGCGLLGHHGCLLGRLWGHGQGIEGLDRSFNCGCGGSYNYPVPPLYTYHWPGMYKQPLMTDYRSPWRFPPLKPYVDEVPLPMAVIEGEDGQLIPVSLERGLAPLGGAPDRVESISSRLERTAR